MQTNEQKSTNQGLSYVGEIDPKLKDAIIKMAGLPEKERKEILCQCVNAGQYHDASCDCHRCFLYQAWLGYVEEHGPFELTQLNWTREQFGLGPLPEAEHVENPE